jgi:hypothetical protein
VCKTHFRFDHEPKSEPNGNDPKEEELSLPLHYLPRMLADTDIGEPRTEWATSEGHL